MSASEGWRGGWTDLLPLMSAVCRRTINASQMPSNPGLNILFGRSFRTRQMQREEEHGVAM